MIREVRKLYRMTKNHEKNEHLVVKSNQLIQKSKINLSLYEQRIVNFMISKIMADDIDFKFIELDYANFCGLCEIKNTNRAYIKKIIKDLADKSWWWFDGKKDILIRWIGEAELTSDIIRLKFHPKMEQFLLNLKEYGSYTQSELLYYLSFKNKYTPILYDYCRSFVNLTFRNKVDSVEVLLTIDELRAKLGLSERENCHKYQYFKDLRVYVIEPTLKEINDLTDISVKYELIKKSRKVDKIRLIIQVRDVKKRLKMIEDRRVNLENDKANI